MKKSNSFQKFSAKSNAAKKEQFKQEKRKWRKEREEFFEKKKSEARGQKPEVRSPTSDIRPLMSDVMPLNKFIAHCGVCSRREAADWVKSGKVSVNATLPVTLVMLEAIRDFHHVTGKKIGMKPAGGISNAKLALAYLVLLYETMGAEWMTADMFRIGASSLLNDVLMQIRKEKTGAYQSGDYFTLD